MRQISDQVFAEFYLWGCNPGFVATADGVFMIDTPQQPIDAVRWRERLQERGPLRQLVNTEPHGDHIMGNAYFPGIEVIGQIGMLPRYNDAIPTMASDQRVETMKTADPDSVWLLRHPSYPPNPPSRLFERELELHLGNHTVRLIHMPGHTPPQTSVFLPDEGVVFTGDNVFHRCKTFIQEADPWEWLAALEAIRALGAETIVPGHGEPCTNECLTEQAAIIEGWVGAVEDFVRRGMTLDEAVAQPAPDVDPYPIGQRLFPAVDGLNQRIVRNLYPRIVARNATR